MSQLFSQIVSSMLLRDLDALEKEISGYASEDSIWKVLPGTANSAGTLCLHLCGNLQHFIGAVLGKTGYVRDRDAEFSQRNIPRSELLGEIARTRNAVGILEVPGTAVPEQDYPIPVGDKTVKTGYFLAHLIAHFNYHLGQVNYHRRALNNI